MARVDYQQVVVRLRALIAAKPNHGQRDLLAAMASLEAEAMMDEDAYRAFLSRFGEEVEETVLGLLPTSPDGGLTLSGAASSELIQDLPRTPIAHPGHDEGATPCRQDRRTASTRT